MNDGKHSMFQGSVHDAPMRFGGTLIVTELNFLIKIFLFVKMEKCHAAIEKKSASCTPQIGHLASYITYKTFCSCQVQTTVPKHIFKNTETAPCAKIFMVHECRQTTSMDLKLPLPLLSGQFLRLTQQQKWD